MAAPVPYWKLHRLAPRAERVSERRASEAPALDVCRNTLQPAARKYIAAYDEAQRYERQLRREMSAGRDAVATLLGEMRQWLPLLARDVPDFDRSTFADSVVPDDVLSDSERCLGGVERCLRGVRRCLGRVGPKPSDRSFSAIFELQPRCTPPRWLGV
jgi:hypothetical protein